MPNSSMRARVTAIFALIVTSLMISGGWLVLRRERRLSEYRVRQTLKVAVLRARSEMEEAAESQRALLEVVREDQGEIAAGGLILFVTDSNDKLVWRSRNIPYPLDHEHWRSQKMKWGNQNLILVSDFSGDEAELHETAMALVIMSIVVVLATSITAWFLVGKTLLPIQKLASQAHASPGTLNVRLVTPSSDAEMQHLTATLNDFLERLQRDAQARGRFYAAASHELRTPLQALLGHLDVALSRKRAADDYEAALLEAQDHTERLTTLVQDLLQLNALEMGASVAACERLNIDEYVVRVLKLSEKARLERDLTFDLKLTEIEIDAPPAHLEMLLRNLTENAVKYALASSTLEITVSQDESDVVFSVWNSCEDRGDVVEDSDLSAWFEPFFRLDASRNSMTGGNGLGLAICASIARANGWTLCLQAKNGGVLASILFPPQASCK